MEYPLASLLLRSSMAVLLGLTSVELAFTPSTWSEEAPSQDVAVFRSTDYQLSGPDILPAGPNVLRLENDGQEAHHLQLLKLEEGKSAQDLMAALQFSTVEIPAWAKQAGGPNGVSAGRYAEATVSLALGRYVVVCVIPRADGIPHVALGMYKELQVVPSAMPRAVPAAFPNHDIHLAMRDFEFAVPEPITRGRHTFRVVNRGHQPHEVVLVQLDDGATLEDVVASFKPSGSEPMPGQLIGGVTGLEPDGAALFTVTLSPGHYGFVCLYPNPHSDMAHGKHGMVLPFTVK